MRGKHSVNKLIFCSIAILTALACALPGAAPTAALPTQPPGFLETIVVQTADAAMTQTATAAPSFTPTWTPVNTLIPSLTPSPVTPTPTFILLIATETPVVSPTVEAQFTVSVGSGSGRSVTATVDNAAKFKTPKPWDCIVTARSGNGAIIKPKANFTLSWTVKNTGTKVWTDDTIDFVYQSGYRQVGGKIHDLSGTVASGGQVTVRVSFEAPKKEGTYNVIWALQVGSDAFCRMKSSFEVQKP